ncbi:hypothetical protein HK097_000924 [Rhizophlyctis rosea]|uniref:Uncharacterized protein n=1 Tax=Rhizophlyctis rosea TaxID=64517 RepID=A0AAD5SHW3_9FUNG|nr:hypothetical protein HK097_000924 [Rhizophlyctis rosea]
MHPSTLFLAVTAGLIAGVSTPVKAGTLTWKTPTGNNTSWTAGDIVKIEWSYDDSVDGNLPGRRKNDSIEFMLVDWSKGESKDATPWDPPLASGVLENGSVDGLVPRNATPGSGWVLRGRSGDVWTFSSRLTVLEPKPETAPTTVLNTTGSRPSGSVTTSRTASAGVSPTAAISTGSGAGRVSPACVAGMGAALMGAVGVYIL